MSSLNREATLRLVEVAERNAWLGEEQLEHFLACGVSFSSPSPFTLGRRGLHTSTTSSYAPYNLGPIGASAFASTPNFLCYTGPPGYEIQFPDSYIRPECGDCGSEACVGGGGPTCGGFSYPCCADAAEAYSRASWFDAAYVGSGSCSCIIPKGSDLGIAGGASSAIDICAADVY